MNFDSEQDQEQLVHQGGQPRPTDTTNERDSTKLLPMQDANGKIQMQSSSDVGNSSSVVEAEHDL